jgi:CRP/FNR family transcriptional regulator, cyclic AMP receptor protein
MRPEAEALRRAPMFAGLAPESLDHLADRLHHRRYQPGEVIFSQGEAGSELLILQAGEIKISQRSPTNEEIILSLLRAGDTFGELALLDGLPRSANAIATAESEVLGLHRDAFTSLLDQEPEALRAVLKALAAVIRGMNVKIQDVTMLDVHGRIAKVLLEMADRYGRPVPEGIRIDRPLTADELAALTGLHRVEVARWLREYQYDDQLRIENDYITLRDIHVWQRRLERI